MSERHGLLLFLPQILVSRNVYLNQQNVYLLLEPLPGSASLTPSGREGGDSVTLEDVTLHFLEEEWAVLDSGNRALYEEVMEEIYGTLASLGFRLTGGVLAFRRKSFKLIPLQSPQ
uniref:KRAB domain-containing protein n=1 Tax=Salvator merianae TaxID=96440 RepID=A0A8D0E4P0_SALMN